MNLKVYLVDAKTAGKQFAVKAFAKESIGIPNKANPKVNIRYIKITILGDYVK